MTEHLVDMFGGCMFSDPPPARGRGPKGGKHYVKPQGYAGIPGTGPKGKTCWDCQYYVRHCGGARLYPKCALRRATWTGGRGSDIIARSPACSYFEEPSE